MDFISDYKVGFNWQIIGAIFGNSQLTMGLEIIVTFLGCLLPFYTIPYRYTLPRAPYFLTITLLIFVTAFLALFFEPYSRQSPYFHLLLIFVHAFLAMSLSIMRARDGFGRGAFAVLFLIPFLNIGLFTVSHAEGEKPYPKNHKQLPLPKFCLGISGTVIATLIWLSPLLFAFASDIYAMAITVWHKHNLLK